MNTKLKKGLAALAFAAVATPAAAGAAYEFIPPFNGHQSSAVWEAKAELAVVQKLGLFANDVTYVPDSAKSDGTTGNFDGKLMDFNVTGPFGIMQATAKVQCDQARVNGLHGGEITCTVVSVNQFRPK